MTIVPRFVVSCWMICVSGKLVKKTIWLLPFVFLAGLNEWVQTWVREGTCTCARASFGFCHLQPTCEAWMSVFACLHVSQWKVSVSVWDVKPRQVLPWSKFRWLPVGSGLLNSNGNYLRLLDWNISQIPSGYCGKSTCSWTSAGVSAAAGEVTRC